MPCVAGIVDLTMSMVGDVSQSRRNIWPNGVQTNEDMKRFARLIVGPTASLEDYSQSRLPEDREDIFLFVSRGGCEQGTRLAELANCVPDMMEELTRHAEANGNTFRPADVYQTGSDAAYADSCFDSVQLCRSHCTCKISCGGEGRSNLRRFLNPDCQQWIAGQRFESVLLDALQQNSLQHDVGDNAYLRKAFHALLNRYRHSANSRIVWHSDSLLTYVPEDPITALSWGATGVLLIKAKDRLNQVVKVLVSRPGDVYMCGGLFQQRLEHAVPPVREWPQILDQHRAELNQLEVSAMEEEIRCRHVERVRHHINLRWHTHHDYCSPIWMAQAAASSADNAQQPAVTETVRGLPANANSQGGSAMHIGLFVKLDMQASISVASSAAASAGASAAENVEQLADPDFLLMD